MKRTSFLFLLFGLLNIISLSAQTWMQSQDTLLNGVSGLNRFNKSGSTLVANNTFQVFRIPDLSQDWEIINPTGIPLSDRVYCTSYSCGDTLFIVTFRGNTYRSSDAGQNWQQVSLSGFSQSLSINNYFFIFSFGNFDFLQFPSDSTFITSDGIHWNYFCPGPELFNVGLQNVIRDSAGYAIVYDNNMQVLNTALMPSTAGIQDYSHYQYQYDLGAGIISRYDFLQPASGYQASGTITVDPSVVNSSGNYLICGNMQLIFLPGHIYLSADNGQTWSLRTDLNWIGNSSPFALTPDSIFCYDNFTHGYNFSSDAGITWQNVNHVKAFGYEQINYSDSHDTILCAPSPTDAPDDFPLGMIRSLDGGQTWELANSGLPLFNYYYDTTLTHPGRISGPFRSGNTYMIYYLDIDSMYTSTDAGASWQHTNRPTGDYPIFIGTDGDQFFIYGEDAVNYINYYSRSNDNGQTWTPLNVPVGDTIGNNSYVINSVQGRNDTLVARIEQFYYPSNFSNHRLFLSVDDGSNWTDITPNSFLAGPEKISDFVDYPYHMNSLLSYNTRSDQFILVVRQIDTTQVLNPYSYPLTYNDSLYYFDGTNWSVIQHTGLPADIDIQSLTYFSGAYYIGSNYGAYISYDNGLTWDGSSVRYSSGSQQPLSNNGLTGNLEMYQMKANNSKLQVSSNGNGIWWFDFVVTGTSGNSQKKISLQIYPSPVISGQQIFWTLSESLDHAKVFVTDANGRIINQTLVSSNADARESISTSGLSSGVYNIIIQNGTNHYTGQFIVR